MEIRRIHDGEVASLVRDLWVPFAEEMERLDEFDELATDEDYAAGTIAYYTELVEDEDVATFVAAGDGDLVGYATIRYSGAPPVFARDGVGHFEEIYVAPDHRREGVATRLMEAGEDWADDRGVDYTTLSVNAANDTAQAFYAARGYDVFRHRLRRDA